MSRVIFEAARTGRSARTRLVMLPAAYASPQDFVSAGFASAVRARRLDLDLAFAAPAQEHVTDRIGLARLRSELILPARAQGCAVWLGGISLGGFHALCCAERHATELGGLCLFAPYLGTHLVTGEIERAGGVAGWDPHGVAEDDDERRVWRFIKALRSGPLPVHLGLGRDDRFSGRHRLMAAALEPASVDIVPGGHDWATWRSLWERFLDARFADHALAAGE
jgi:pimeloyl-ACP methyl ester carboxylesterase